MTLKAGRRGRRGSVYGRAFRRRSLPRHGTDHNSKPLPPLPGILSDGLCHSSVRGFGGKENSGAIETAGPSPWLRRTNPSPRPANLVVKNYGSVAWLPHWKLDSVRPGRTCDVSNVRGSDRQDVLPSKRQNKEERAWGQNARNRCQWSDGTNDDTIFLFAEGAQCFGLDVAP
jgi:hypothetical protein